MKKMLQERTHASVTGNNFISSIIHADFFSLL